MGDKEVKMNVLKKARRGGEDEGFLKEAGFLEAICKATPLAHDAKMVAYITSEEAETLGDG